MKRRWILPQAANPLLAGRLLRELDVPPFLAALLVQRGYGEVAGAQEFLHPKMKSLLPPELLPQMPLAAERVWEAVRAGRRIVLYGDYDVDGVTSLALLSRILKVFGANVECFLPLRVEEGYGLSAAFFNYQVNAEWENPDWPRDLGVLWLFAVAVFAIAFGLSVCRFRDKRR